MAFTNRKDDDDDIGSDGLLVIAIPCILACVVILIVSSCSVGTRHTENHYRQKEKQGLVEYYDELNQKWLWKERSK